ncbi:MAG: fatty acid desaturase [Planctomycetes bacterium]|nr:fatty acid desaturase [Planctomycetota bacterium]
MRAKQLGKTLNSKELNGLVHPLRFLDNYTNLLCLAMEYATLAAISVPTIAFCELHASWGLHWGWCIPVVIAAIFLNGAVLHRIGGLGHEGSHYILMKNRYLNELISDLFCMFPLFATTEQYRLIHLGHHEYTNDWERDPELLNLGKTRMMDQFPMSRWEFIYHFYVRVLWPPALFRYLWDNIWVTALGKGVHPYPAAEGNRQPPTFAGFRITSLLGVTHFAVMSALMGYLSLYGNAFLLIVVPIVGWLVALGAILAIPEHMFFHSRLKPVYSPKITSAIRLGYYTAMNAAVCWPVYLTGHMWGIYVWLLWVIPLVVTFPYYMLLRDLYQHANADDGKLTNSRVIYTDPITRWAMFIYGQDAHLTHHLYPAVPHYNLQKLHRLLKEHNAEYAEHVVECHGTFWNRTGQLTLLDVIEKPTREPEPDLAAELDMVGSGAR